MEQEGTYSFNIAVVGPDDDLNSKFMRIIAETHGHVDGVEFHQGKIDRMAALLYWQPHQDSISPILVSHSLKNANGAIVLMEKRHLEELKKFKDLIKENAGNIPIKEIIFDKDMEIKEIGDIVFNSIHDLSAQMIVEAEQKSKRKKLKSISKLPTIKQSAGQPQFYVDKYGVITTFPTRDSVPLYQEKRFVRRKKKKIKKIKRKSKSQKTKKSKKKSENDKMKKSEKK